METEAPAPPSYPAGFARMRLEMRTTMTEITHRMSETRLGRAFAQMRARTGGLFLSTVMHAAQKLSGRGVQQVVRHWYIRARKLAVVKVYSGSDRIGRFAFASGYTGLGSEDYTDPVTGVVGKKPSVAAQAGIMRHSEAIGEYKEAEHKSGRWKQMSKLTAVGFASGGAVTFPRFYGGSGKTPVCKISDRLRDRGVEYVDQLFATDVAYEELGGSSVLNVSHVLTRWEQRVNYWDAGIPAEGRPGTSRIRDTQRLRWEQLSVDNYLADLFVLDPAYDPGCPKLEYGAEVSHLAESCHNPKDWARLEFQFFPDTEFVSMVFAKGTPTTAVSIDEAHRTDFARWRPGFKVELCEQASAENNRSRQICTIFQYHWMEHDGRPVAPAGNPRTLRVERPSATEPNEVDVLYPTYQMGDEQFQPPESAVCILPDDYPTACPHSVFGMYPCYGLRMQMEELRAFTGASPHRRTIVPGERASPGLAGLSPYAPEKWVSERRPAPAAKGKRRKSDEPSASAQRS